MKFYYFMSVAGRTSSTRKFSIVVVSYTGRKKTHLRRAADCKRLLREAVFLSLETLKEKMYQFL